MVLGVGLATAAGTASLATRPAARREFAPARCEAAEGPPRPEIVDALPAGLALGRSKLQVFQFESCPFCRKVRACLDYLKLPYEIVEVHPLSKKETLEVAPDYKKVPVLLVEGEDGVKVQLRDSKTIVCALLGDASFGAHPDKVAPPVSSETFADMWTEEEQAVGNTAEEKWIHWTDKVLVQCIVMNVYRTFSESAETFRYLLTHPSFPWLAARSGAWSGTVVMWGVAKAKKRKFGISDERAALYEACETFASAVDKGGKPFLAGDQPGAADFNVYGVLKSTESCQTERDILANCQGLLPWWGSMEKVVGPTQAVNVSDVKRGP